MVLITRLTKSHDPLSKMLNGQVGNSVVLLVQVLDVITLVNVKLLLLGIIKGTTVTTAMKATVRKDV